MINCCHLLGKVYNLDNLENKGTLENAKQLEEQFGVARCAIWGICCPDEGHRPVQQCCMYTFSHLFSCYKGTLTVIIYRRVKVFLKSVSAKGQLLRGEAAGEKSFVF